VRGERVARDPAPLHQRHPVAQAAQKHRSHSTGAPGAHHHNVARPLYSAHGSNDAGGARAVLGDRMENAFSTKRPTAKRAHAAEGLIRF
jgi:hypothetical protein